jgi:hypothetical protein
MARRKAAFAADVPKKRNRRSPEEIIAALQAKIEDVQRRAKAKELKGDPLLQKTLVLVRQLDRTMTQAEEAGNNRVRHALAASRQPLAEFLEEQGVRLPKPRMPRGRKPKALVS